MEKTLEVTDLKIYYKTLRGYSQAVDEISFDVVKGEIFGVAGESGCGKSTLGNALVLVKPPMYYMGGEALFEGRNLFTLPKEDMNKVRFEKVSIIPQYAQDALSPTKKVRTLIKDLAGEHKIKADDAFFAKVLERFRLVNLDEDVLDKFALELSGGMKQRAVLVISTLLDPRLLIADEISSALDVTSQRYVADMIVQFRDAGIVGSVFFITHDLALLNEVADRIMIMYAGHVVEIAPTETIIRNPQHPYTKALISSLPRAGVRYQEQKLTGIPGYPPTLLNIPQGCRFRDRCPCKTDKCDSARPPSIEVEAGHIIACWNWRTAA